MTRQVVATPHAPKAIGPYSQGVVVEGGRTLYTAGQIAMDPSTGEIVGGGDVAAQTERVMHNLAAVLEAAGMRFEHVVRAGIYIVNMSDFAAVNEIYAKRFTTTPPARSTVQIAGLPRGALVEIDLVAVAP